MVLSDEKRKQYTKRLLTSRMRILCSNGFYGLLLMHVGFTLDESCQTAATDGNRIYFSPQFLDDLSDSELDFILMHEILHVVLRHCNRQGDRDDMLFNVACDIVVNSNVLLSQNMDLNAITLEKYGVSMHIAPNGKEGYEYTAEQVYEMLPAVASQRKLQNKAKGRSGARSRKKGGNYDDEQTLWDDHSRWETSETDEKERDLWVKRFEDACEAISVRDPSNQRGTLPAFAVRILNELKKPQTDWRTILDGFVQEEVVDYSFAPPDRRFGESPFFLPDFNDKDFIVKDILFMIDTSASMSDEMITAAYSEVKGAIDQFDGKLKGWLGFFDAAIIEPKEFSDEEQFRVIKPAGGGGTDFGIIFAYVNKYMRDNLPASIIILTDGYAPFPKESAAAGIPVLWLLCNEKVIPPWGKVARIRV